MKVTIKLFAVARQRAGRETIDVELPARATVAALRAAIVQQYATLADVVRHARFAINSDYAGDTTPISPTSEVALIPPVSGG